MTDQTETKLKPCPFCGGAVEIAARVEGRLTVRKLPQKKEYSVACGNKYCGVQPRSKWYGSKQEAIDAWNKRPRKKYLTAEQRLEYQRAYRAAHREHIRERERKYREEHKEEIRRYQREYYAKYLKKGGDSK